MRSQKQPRPELLHSLLCKPLPGVSEYQRGVFYQTQIDSVFPQKRLCGMGQKQVVKGEL